MLLNNFNIYKIFLTIEFLVIRIFLNEKFALFEKKYKHKLLS